MQWTADYLFGCTVCNCWRKSTHHQCNV